MGNKVWKGRDECIVVDQDQPLGLWCPAFVEMLYKGEIGFCEGQSGVSYRKADVDWRFSDGGFEIHD